MAKKISKSELGIDGNIFSDLTKSMQENKAVSESLKIVHNALKDQLKETSKQAGNLRKELDQANTNTVSGLKEYTVKQKEANQLLLDAEKIKQAELRTLKAIEQAKQAELRTAKMVNSESAKTLTAYQKESKALNEMRNRYKDLAVQKANGIKLTKDERKEMRNLISEIQKSDTNLKKIDATVGQNQRNVGNYTKAVGGLKNGLAQLGLAFGGFQLAKSAFNTISEFDTSMADLSAITGLAGKDLDFFKENAISMGVDVKGGASAVVEAYKLIASAKPELLENAEALNAVTDSAILLSRASGMELPEAATALTDAMNQFGAGADEAGKFVDVLAAGAKFGSAEIPQITEALLKFGAVAKTSNVSIQESTGLIEALAERGLKGAEAGTALRNVMLKLSAPDALPKEAQERLKELGISFDDLKDQSKPFSERLELLKPLLNDSTTLIKVFGTENAVAATNLISSTERIQKLTASVNENGVAQDQANTRSKTLSEAFNRFKETINGLVLSFSNGADSAGIFVKSLDFLTRNIGTIISLVTKLGAVFLIYKTRLIAINVAQKIFGDGTGKMNVSLKQLGSNLKDATSSAGGMGGALKSIGWSSLIALGSALAFELYEIASGARQAQLDLKRLNETTEDALQSVNKNIAKIKEGQSKSLSALDRELKLNLAKAKTDKERNKLEQQYLIDKEKLIGSTEKEIRQNIILVNQRKNRFIELKKETEELTKIIQKTDSSGKDIENAMKRLNEIQKELGIKGSTSYFGLIENSADFVEITSQLKANINGTNTRITEYKKLLGETSEELKDATIDTEVNTISKRENTKAIEEQNKETREYIDLTEEILRQSQIQQENEELLNDFRISENRKASETLLQQEIDRAKKTGEVYTETYKDLLQKEENFQRELIELQFIRDIDNATSQADVELAQTKRMIALSQLEQEYVQLKVDGINQINEAQEDYISQEDEIVETEKKNYEERNKYIELATEFLEKQIDRRIEALDREIEAQQRQQDILQELANNGNINAQQSLAVSAELERQAQAEKLKQEQRKQQLQIVSSFLTSYNMKLEEGKSGGEAFSEALAEKAVLEAFLTSLPAFYEGTEDTGRVSNPLDANGGRVAILHDNERVMTKAQNEKLQGLTNEQIVSIVTANQTSAPISAMSLGWESVAVLSELNGLKSEMKSVRKAIEDKPETNYNVEGVVNGVLSLTKATKQGNSITYNRFKIK
jgi:TP901 family phage tail tape measure protein